MLRESQLLVGVAAHLRNLIRPQSRILHHAAGSIGVGIIGKNFALDLELQAAQTDR